MMKGLQSGFYAATFAASALMFHTASVAHTMSTGTIAEGRHGISTPETSSLFKRHVDRASGVVSYILEPGRFGHNQQSIYFTAKSMTDDGRFLLFNIRSDEFAVKNGKKVKVKSNMAMVDFKLDSVVVLTGVPGQIPFLDVREDKLYYIARNPDRLCRRDLLVDPTKEIVVCTIPKEELLAGGDHIGVYATHLTLTADRSRAFLDLRVDDRFIQGMLVLESGKFEKWSEVDHVINHGAVNPVDDRIALGAWEVDWTDQKGRHHPIPRPTKENPNVVYPRLTLLRPGVEPETVPPKINNYATHENWAEDGKGFYYCSNCVIYHDLATGRQSVIVPMDAGHAAMSADNRYVTFDSPDYAREGWYRGCSWNVCFWNRETSCGLYVHTLMPPLCPKNNQSRLHPDPHPQFVMNGRYIVCTLNERGRMNLSVTPVAPLIARTTPDPLREAHFTKWNDSESPGKIARNITARFISNVQPEQFSSGSAAVTNWFAAACRQADLSGVAFRRIQLKKYSSIWNAPSAFTHPFLVLAEKMSKTPYGVDANERDVALFRSYASKIVRSEDGGEWKGVSESPYFAWALVLGVRRGWIEPTKYGPAARRAWLAVVRSVAKKTGDPEANAAALWAANALNER